MTWGADANRIQWFQARFGLLLLLKLKSWIDTTGTCWLLTRPATRSYRLCNCRNRFLIRENLPEAVGDDFYEFVPYSYGPFCAEVYQDAERLQSRNRFVHIEQGQYKQYSVTPAGRNHATELEGDLPPETVDYVHRVVAWAKSLSFSELVQAIYQKYPDYRVNSVFQG